MHHGSVAGAEVLHTSVYAVSVFKVTTSSSLGLRSRRVAPELRKTATPLEMFRACVGVGLRGRCNCRQQVKVWQIGGGGGG